MNALPAQAEASPEAFAEYQRSAATWEQDRVAQAGRSERRAWIVAGIAGITTVLALAGATAAYLRPVPLPAVVQVDVATGAPVLVPAIGAPPMSARERHIKYMVWQYVQAREGWSFHEDERLWRRVMLMTLASLQAQFRDEFLGPNGPRATLGQEGVAVVHPISVELAGPEGHWTGARVRFSKDTIGKRGGDAVRSYAVASLDFIWSSDAITTNEILVNPFGMLVTRYRVDPETPR